MKDEDARERAAIIAVIEAESAAWMRGDVEAWKACWVQAPHAQHISARPSIGAHMFRGFDRIEAYLVPLVSNLGAHGPGEGAIRRENWEINIGADMAWATFDQLIPLGNIADAAPGRHNQLRVLEKIDGLWRIAAVFQISNRIGYYTHPWVRVGRNGQIAESAPDADAALAVHPSLMRVGERLVARTEPDEQKLRAALADADESLRQRKSRRPQALVLSEPTGSGISLVWVTIADMMIVVLLGDDRLLANSIATAGEVFGLSRAQLRVAEQIARGRDLSEIAAALGVAPSTVRTHVRRMFQRLEVSSQPALIRALLSAEAPRP